jgi:hypothetical protein
MSRVLVLVRHEESVGRSTHPDICKCLPKLVPFELVIANALVIISQALDSKGSVFLREKFCFGDVFGEEIVHCEREEYVMPPVTRERMRQPWNVKPASAEPREQPYATTPPTMLENPALAAHIPTRPACSYFVSVGCNCVS